MGKEKESVTVSATEKALDVPRVSSYTRQVIRFFLIPNSCKVLPDLWYLGERCQTAFPLWLVIFLAVIGFLILLVVLLIICFCVIKKRNKKKKELWVSWNVFVCVNVCKNKKSWSWYHFNRARNEEFKKVFANKAFVNDEPKTFIKPVSSHSIACDIYIWHTVES